MRFDEYTPEGFQEKQESEQSNYEYPYSHYYQTGGGTGSGPHRGSGGKWVAVLVVVGLLVGSAALLRGELDWAIFPWIDSLEQPEKEDAAPEKKPEQTQENSEPDIQEPTGAQAVNSSGATLQITQNPDIVVAEDDGKETAGLSLQEIYKKMIPSVVSVMSTSNTTTSTGTGIIMTEDGYIITNEHVISDAVTIDVLLQTDETFSAAVVGSDEASDLAVLKIEADNLTPAEFGDSDQLEVGDEVAAIGDPLGIQLRGTMTNGIISAINRDLTINNRTMTLIQTNAALNSGNSGGPLINNQGQVIGITALKLSSYYDGSIEGLGFAIPISTAKPIIDELIEKGYVSGRPALGITGEHLPTAVRLYYRLPEGVYVSEVDPNSDAYAKGIMAGDIIVAINGVQVTTTDQLEVVKNQFSAGDAVTLTIYRGGEQFDVEVVLVDKAQHSEN